MPTITIITFIYHQVLSILEYEAISCLDFNNTTVERKKSTGCTMNFHWLSETKCVFFTHAHHWDLGRGRPKADTFYWSTIFDFIPTHQPKVFQLFKLVC